MPTSTTNYGLQKPLVNNATDQDLWGGYLNDDMDDIDGLTKTALNWTPSAQTANFSVSAPTTGSTTTGSSKLLYRCDATLGTVTAALPAAAGCSGMTVAFKKTDATANTVIIDGNASETIDGAATFTLSNQYEWIIVTSNGTSWDIVSKYSQTIPDATTSVKGIVQLATAAEQEAGTEANKAITPSIAQSHPSAAKAWVVFDASGGITASYNVSGVSKNATGDYTISFTTAFSSVNYAAIGTNGYISGGGTTSLVWTVISQAVGSCNVISQISGGAATDPVRSHFVFYGDQ